MEPVPPAPPAAEGPQRRAFDLRIRPTEVRVDTAALQHNLRQVRAFAPRSRVLAMVKADGYGHGLGLAARAFVEAGADWLGVALVEEGLALRRLGLTAPILALGGQYTDYGLLLQHAITPIVYRADMLDALAAAARARGVIAEAHLKVDTGMGRLGAAPDELPSLFERARRTPEVRITGLLSHLANADAGSKDAVREPLALFHDARRRAVEVGLPIQLCHLANSAAVLDHPETHFDLVRPGILLYGAAPAPALEGRARVKPALTWATGVAHLKRVPRGASVSYGSTWTAQRDSLVATLPVGYADGYRRGLSNRAPVLLAGQRAPQIGTVCMDMILVDATDVAGRLAPGSEAVLLGQQGDAAISAAELARLCETIPYEIFCGIGARVPRVAL